MLASIILISSLILTDESIQILSEQKFGGKTNVKARYPDSHNITQIFFYYHTYLTNGKK